ncbi:hypothetical protein Scep_002946 [Stephania cephalantha]|uniref:MI domain-containing protein n=1 Tax=Stephania cephalantha TaxID=152367 RepID=A0AAP0Q530_9MAGN
MASGRKSRDDSSGEDRRRSPRNGRTERGKDQSLSTRSRDLGVEKHDLDSRNRDSRVSRDFKDSRVRVRVSRARASSSASPSSSSSSSSDEEEERKRGSRDRSKRVEEEEESSSSDAERERRGRRGGSSEEDGEEEEEEGSGGRKSDEENVVDRDGRGRRGGRRRSDDEKNVDLERDGRRRRGGNEESGRKGNDYEKNGDLEGSNRRRRGENEESGRKRNDDEKNGDLEGNNRRRRGENEGSGRKFDDDENGDLEKSNRRRHRENEESGRDKDMISSREVEIERREKEKEKERKHEDSDRRDRSGRRAQDINGRDRDRKREREKHEDAKEFRRDRERTEREHRRGREGRNSPDKDKRRDRDKNDEREEGQKNIEKSTKDDNERGGDGRRVEDSTSQKPTTSLQDGSRVANNENLGRSGGIYLPPFRLARMMQEEKDKNSDRYQRLSWDALRKSINGLVNKVNASNIKNIIPELFAENLIRGRGLFCRSCMKSQMASPGFTDVFAALVAVVNTRFPDVGELLLKRVVLQLKRAYKRNDKPQLLAATKFIAHLVNQQVAHEIIALELLTVLLENPSDDSVEVAVGFVTECGSYLQEFSPQGLHGIFERFRGILHEGEIDKRVQFLIEGLFAIRKAKFQGHPAIRPDLDLVKGDQDQLTHELSLEDQIDPEVALDIFKPDPQYEENENRYEQLKKNILGDESAEDEDSDADSDDEEDEESEGEDEEAMEIKDETETNLVNLRRTIYLTIMSSVDFEEAGHKLLKIKLESGQEMELCIMLLECCSQERTYLRYYGLLGQRFCMINKVYQENFEKCFVQQYSMIHRLETNKLRNVAKFFAHLLGTDALPWHVLAYIRLTEEDTTSSSRIFIKILFQELSEHLGIRLLNEKLSDPTMQDSFESIFPRDNPKNTRFSINFFTSIGLGGITENLREYLKNMPRLIMQQQQPVSESESESGSSSSSDSGSSSGSESEEDRRQKRRKKR